MRLTDFQREQLRALAGVRNSGTTGSAYWYPSGSGQFRSANVLVRHGLLRRVMGSMRCYELTDEGFAVGRVPAQEDPLEGANCSLCGRTADNFHVSDELWEQVGLGDVQACFKCFRIAAWHSGVRPDPGWQVSL